MYDICLSIGLVICPFFSLPRSTQAHHCNAHPQLCSHCADKGNGSCQPRLLHVTAYCIAGCAELDTYTHGWTSIDENSICQRYYLQRMKFPNSKKKRRLIHIQPFSLHSPPICTTFAPLLHTISFRFIDQWTYHLNIPTH